MAQIDFYLDITLNRRIVSLTDISVQALPPFVQGSMLPIRLYLVQSEGSYATPTRIPTSGITLQMALGTKVGSSSTHYAEQATWTPGTDLADPYWDADFSLNTAGVTALLGSNPSVRTWFEIQMLTPTPTVLLQQEVTVNAAVSKPGDLVVPAGLTPLSAEGAGAVFLTRTIQGVVRWVSPDGTKQADVSYGDDGAWHVDPVT